MREMIKLTVKYQMLAKFVITTKFRWVRILRKCQIVSMIMVYNEAKSNFSFGQIILFLMELKECCRGVGSSVDDNM